VYGFYQGDYLKSGNCAKELVHYFTGEVTSPRYHSSVHRAYLSGVDQANAVLHEIQASHQGNIVLE